MWCESVKHVLAQVLKIDIIMLRRTCLSNSLHNLYFALIVLMWCHLLWTQDRNSLMSVNICIKLHVFLWKPSIHVKQPLGLAPVIDLYRSGHSDLFKWILQSTQLSSYSRLSSSTSSTNLFHHKIATLWPSEPHICVSCTSPGSSAPGEVRVMLVYMQYDDKAPIPTLPWEAFIAAI